MSLEGWKLQSGQISPGHISYKDKCCMNICYLDTFNLSWIVLQAYCKVGGLDGWSVKMDLNLNSAEAEAKAKAGLSLATRKQPKSGVQTSL